MAGNGTSHRDQEPSPLAYLGVLSEVLSPICAGPLGAPWKLGEGIGREPVHRSDYRKTAIVFQPVNSQFAQVDLTLQLKLWGIVFCQYLQHRKQVDGVACHRSGAQVAEGYWIVSIGKTRYQGLTFGLILWPGEARHRYPQYTSLACDQRSH